MRSTYNNVEFGFKTNKINFVKLLFFRLGLEKQDKSDFNMQK